MLTRKNLLIWRAGVRLAYSFTGKRNHYSFEPVAVEPPFLLISNHVSDVDFVPLGILFRDYPPAFVASDHIKRIRIAGKVFIDNKFIIPIKKGALSLGSIKEIIKTMKEGRAVVLFAEGDSTWNGVSSEVYPATGKLVKLMKCPLVTYRLEGGCFTGPRWAEKKRSGEFRGKVAGVYSADELAKMSTDEINERINKDIYFNPYEREDSGKDSGNIRDKESGRYSRQYKGPAYAAGLHRALFICPSCRKMGFLDSRKDEIFCSNCGMSAGVDGCGGISFNTPVSGKINSTGTINIYDWDKWQEKVFADVIKAEQREEIFAFNGKITDLTEDKDFRLTEKTGSKASFALNIANNSITVKTLNTENGSDAVRSSDTVNSLNTENGSKFRFSDIRDMAVAQTNRLLFTTDKGYFEIFSKNAILRPYLWAWRNYKNGSGKEK